RKGRSCVLIDHGFRSGVRSQTEANSSSNEEPWVPLAPRALFYSTGGSPGLEPRARLLFSMLPTTNLDRRDGLFDGLQAVYHRHMPVTDEFETLGNAEIRSFLSSSQADELHRTVREIYSLIEAASDIDATPLADSFRRWQGIWLEPLAHFLFTRAPVLADRGK